MHDTTGEAIINMFRVNLAVRKDEKVIVFSDRYDKGITALEKRISAAGSEFSNTIRSLHFGPMGCHGTEPPEELWREAFGEQVYRKMKEKKLFRPVLTKNATKEQLREIERVIKRHAHDGADVVIALSYYSTSHTRFRDFLNRICGTRYASMPLFDEAMLSGPMKVDWKKMEERTKKVAVRINKCEKIIVESENGTDITLSKKNRDAHMDTGMITKKGQFSNLPAGEVYLAPVEGTAEGTLVLEWAPTRKLKHPVTLHVRQGMVERVEGKERYVTFLEKKFSEQKENRNIAELGIGTNDRARRPDNILESEKIFGTIHIALGDNSSFGGRVRTPFHQDFVFFKPSLSLVFKSGRRRRLMHAGKLL